MSFGKAKIYFDGSHYIAIPKENFPRKKVKSGKKRKTVSKEKEIFERAYKDSKKLPKNSFFDITELPNACFFIS